MNKFDWLMLFVWPALVTIILLALLASPLLLFDSSPPSTGASAAVADVKYTAMNGKKPIVSEEISEIRALYAPDLFASSRGNRLPPSQTATNRPDNKDIIPSENPLLLSFTPALKTGAQRPATAERRIDNYEADSGFRFHPPERTSPRTNKNLKLAVELKGGLKHFSIDPDTFQDIALPAGRKPWIVQTDVLVNNAGHVERVFAESIDCESSIYQEIVKRLYKCHFSNVTQTCEGTIIISYPAYFAVKSNQAARIK